jgi:hypothetical protein
LFATAAAVETVASGREVNFFDGSILIASPESRRRITVIGRCTPKAVKGLLPSISAWLVFGTAHRRGFSFRQ